MSAWSDQDNNSDEFRSDQDNTLIVMSLDNNTCNSDEFRSAYILKVRER